MLSKDDLNQMTKGQIEILLLGMKIENDAVVKVLRSLKVSEDIIATIKRSK
jgi:hypothetical protein